MSFLIVFQKCDAISGGPELSVDDRSFGMLSLSSMDVKASQAYLYPRLLPVHDLDPADESDTIPVATRCSVDKLREHGAYILENGVLMFLYVGLQVSTASYVKFRRVRSDATRYDYTSFCVFTASNPP